MLLRRTLYGIAALVIGAVAFGACSGRENSGVVGTATDAAVPSIPTLNPRDAAQPFAEAGFGVVPFGARSPSGNPHAPFSFLTLSQVHDVDDPSDLHESLYCGDGIRNPETEECDNGEEQQAPFCTEVCQSQDAVLADQPAPETTRRLGFGRHPLAVGEHAALATFLEHDARGEPSVNVSTFSSSGQRLSSGAISGSTVPVGFSNPVAAAFPSGQFAVAWTAFDVDGDELGIALQKVDPEEPTSSGAVAANLTTTFSQFDPDVLWDGNQLVVAWVDSSSVSGNSDIRFRTFNEKMFATSGEQTLANTPAVEGNVALGAFNGSWAAAWRANDGTAEETIFVKDQGTGTEWSVGPLLAGPETDRPALVELDGSHLLLVFTEGTDPADLGIANTARLRAVVLSLENPGAVDLGQVQGVWSSTLEASGLSDAAIHGLEQSEPNAIKIDETSGYIAWTNERVVGSELAKEVWLKPFSWSIDGDEVSLDLEQDDIGFPRWDDGHLGDQVTPALATGWFEESSPVLFAAWADYGRLTQDGTAEKSEVLGQLVGLPMWRGEEPINMTCSASEPCGWGEGDCNADAECETGLVCGQSNGPQFGWGRAFGVCVPETCLNNELDEGEDRIDCGGDCGACVDCPLGVHLGFCADDPYLKLWMRSDDPGVELEAGTEYTSRKVVNYPNRAPPGGLIETVGEDRNPRQTGYNAASSTYFDDDSRFSSSLDESTFDFLHQAAEATVAIAFKVPEMDPGAPLVSTTDGTSSDSLGFSIYLAVEQGLGVAAGDGSQQALKREIGEVLQADTSYVLIVRKRLYSDPTKVRIDARLNKSAIIDDQVSQQAMGTGSTAQRLAIGGHDVSAIGTERLNGWISEVIIYSRALELDEIDGLEDRLIDRWSCPESSCTVGCPCTEPSGSCDTDADCENSDDCQLSYCIAGECRSENAPPGLECSDEDLCTEGDACTSEGVCAGTPKDCSSLDDACNQGACNPSNGDCTHDPINEGEVCDDDELECTQHTCVDGDCTVSLVPECQICGDGHLENGEDCDDGNSSNTDACLVSCIDATCGDELVWTGAEECDDGNADQDDECLTSCDLASCGDGYLQTRVEVCDDSNEEPGDGCASDCFPEPLQVVVGNEANCVRFAGGQLKCWGRNTFGELGLGDVETRGDEAGEMGRNLPLVDLGTDRTVQTLAAGGTHMCALLDDGRVKCWGNNAHGQLGLGNEELYGDGSEEMGDDLPPVALGTHRTSPNVVVDRAAVGLAAGQEHTCALLDNGTVKCWGYNQGGQLGIGNTSHRGDDANEMGDLLPTVALGTSRIALSLTAGDMHTCALLDDHTVKCWGNSTFGQLGQGDTQTRGDGSNEMGDNLPTIDLGTGRTAQSVTAGLNYTCALLDDDQIKCWGRSTFGEIGLGSTSHRGDSDEEMGDDLPAIDLGTGRSVTTVEAGLWSSCAILDNDAVKCWGRNANGGLGLGDTATRGDQSGEMGDNLPALDLGAERTAQSLDQSFEHACALLDDHTVKCWGLESSLGLGSNASTSRGDNSGEMGDNLPILDFWHEGCGDGAVQSEYEQCEDGNSEDGDGCDNNCTNTGCGNGVLTGSEDCDDGNLNDGDDCTNECEGAFCGDGSVRTGTEQCDDGNASNADACTEGCYSAVCGDGYVRNGVEACDDENTTNGDGCDNNCTATGCGNGIQTAGEECDDGNTVETDYCSSECDELYCGDGVLNGDEECDDGNGVDGDGCDDDHNCTETRCGNGVVTAGEECDDGNTSNTDDCTNDCEVALCGDGFVQAGVEQCDDSNSANTDACVSCFNATCGDGYVQAGVEQCDDDNGSNTDACLSTCNNATCGDGYVRAGVEQCDDANGSNTDACTNSCSNAACGDGYTRAGVEQCDDANASNTDACTNACNNAACGDGYVRSGVEACDDNNLTSGDGCDSNCSVTACGNGITAGTEQCDDANSSNTDACLNTCNNASCGDGYTRAGVEQCDDANSVNSDACTNVCGTAACGDGYVRAGVELCDDSNTTPGDGCAADCVPEPLQIVAGQDHGCARFSGGVVKCWGQNNFGQLGLGDTVNRGDQAGEMGRNLPTLDFGSGRTVQSLAAGGSHTCALLDNNTVKCWGYNGFGQLGQGTAATIGDGANEMGNSLSTVSLGTGRTALKVFAGGTHTCALLDNNTVKCWGYNGYGALGLGDINTRGNTANQMGDNLPAVSLGTGRTAVNLSLGRHTGGAHTCAWLDDNTVKCWGKNDLGQLGYGDTANRGDGANEMGDNLSAVSLGTSRTALGVSAGWDNTCARLDNNTIKCWGHNVSGQLGLGDSADRGDASGEMGDNLPTVSLGTGRSALGLAISGDRNNCALLDNSSLKCWGSNVFGDLGLGDTSSRGWTVNQMGDSLPVVSLGTGRAAQSVASEGGGKCALLDDGTVKCWGKNATGQLGLGDTADRGDGANEMGNNLPALDFWHYGCGDGVVQSYEQCDDNNSVNGDGCDNNCKTTACGNGIVTAGEQCDDGNASNTDACTNACNNATCGDGFTQAGVEQCDDANGSNTDACLNTCNNATCGDGYTRAGVEQCDDANGSNTDACTTSCNNATCGDGYTRAGVEQCDDANGSNTDACLNTCNNATCGDGYTRAGVEQCDDANGSNTDACTNSCNNAVCGDGYLRSGVEVCDDSNTTSGDGCDSNCTVTACGNGVTTGTEQCDDGNGSNTDACLNTCNNASCGDGYIRAGVEQCDDTNSSNTDACTNACTNAACGDGYLRADTEVCDDSNTTAGDGCASDCFPEPLQVVAGNNHSCARFGGGWVKCWGEGANGQLGMGDVAIRGDQVGEMGMNLPIIDLGPGRSAVGLAAGGNHTCALLDNGGVKCWGQNNMGQLGLGDTANRGDNSGEMGSNLAAVSLGTGRTAVSLIAGSGHSCVLLDNNTVKCWGYGFDGQLGLGSTATRGDGANEMGDNLPAVSLGTGRTAVSLTSGSSKTCALLDNATVKCWGYNAYGELGLGDTGNRGDQPNEMGDNLSAVSLGTGRTALSVKAGVTHACALLDNNTVKCWGYNVNGQLGLGDTAHRGDGANEMGDNLPTANLGTGRTAASIHPGGFGSCAILDNGALKCWGGNGFGALGLGDGVDHGDGANEMGDNLPAISLGTNRTAQSLGVGIYHHRCAVLDNQTVKCWGNNGKGQLGQGDTAHRGDAANEMGNNLPAIDFWRHGCGDGVVQSYEQCDDDNTVNGDGCDNNCKTTACGNGIVTTGEQCDDGNASNTDACTNACNNPTCGDGYTQAGVEQCDDANGSNTDACLNTCNNATCGDTYIRAGVEQCDDGNGSNADACTTSCNNATCGDGYTRAGVEQCDDANGSNTDACLNTCNNATCGDGYTRAGVEQCDDANASNTDACTNACNNATCGDGYIRAGVEQCDDANGSNTDACLTTCNNASCGDGYTRAGVEQCDDANASNTDACLNTCNNASCGDGYTRAGVEQCDDANGSNTDACTNACNNATCGDGYLRSGVEACDDSNLTSGDGCDSNCTVTACGNGITTGTEQCDDGNGSNTDACLSTCNNASCGDGYIRAGVEQCDDTNSSNTDACTNACNNAACGDGYLRADTEVCDDSNTTAGDGCASDCYPEPVEVVAGWNHNCARFGNGSVKCWGANASGQLGLGDTASRGDQAGEMGMNLPAVDLGTGRTAKGLSTGASHTCAWLDNDTVKCWGSNSSGQLGLGNTAHRGDGPGEMGDNLPAVSVGTGRTVQKLVAGSSQTCVVLDNNTVKCWGANSSGQLGQGNTTTRGDGANEMGDNLAATNLGTGRTAVALAVGRYTGQAHVCALLDNNTVKCWGRNSSGQLGLGDTSNRGDGANEMGDNLSAVALGTGRTPLSVKVGWDSTCVKLDNNTLKCWGVNSAGELGLGDTSNRGDGANEMGDNLVAVSLGTGRSVSSLNEWGGRGFCAILDNNGLKCWGANIYGDLGLGNTTARGDNANEMGDNLPLVSLGTGRTAVSVTTGEYHRCALLDDRTVKCWGRNTDGPLGKGNTSNLGDQSGEMGDTLTAIDFWHFGCGDGIVQSYEQCDDDNGINGDGCDNNCKTTACGNGIVTAGEQCDDGNASNTDACLNTCNNATCGDTYVRAGVEQCDDGNASNTDACLNTCNNATCGDTYVRAGVEQCDDGNASNTDACLNTCNNATCGDGHTRAGVEQCDDANASNADACTNACNNAACGDGYIRSGVEVCDDSNTTSGDGCDSNCTVTACGNGITTGSEQCDDANASNTDACTNSCNNATCGDGYTRAGVEQCDDANGSNTDACTTACNNAACGDGYLRADTEVCDDTNTTAGDGCASDCFPEPLQVVAGENHSCARFGGGWVKCWGGNTYGQLGLGDTSARGDAAGEMGMNLPLVDLGTGRTAKQLAGGERHTCAILDNDTVKCWGYGTAGRLGLGDTVNHGDGPGEMGANLASISLGTGRTVVKLNAGGSHTCAILDNNVLKCWGDNTYGQLGLGDSAARGDGANEMGDNLPALSLGTGRTATNVSASLGNGISHTCALLDNGTIKCWGVNNLGQLGLGDTTWRGDGANEMGDNLAAVSLGTSRTALSVSTGDGFSCARLDNNTVKCWGYSNQGQLGQGDTVTRGDQAGEMGDSLPVVSLGTSRSAADVEVGGQTTCTLLDNNSAKCWGKNFDGVLGLGNTLARGDGANEMGDNLPAISLGTGRTAASVPDGSNGHRCALLDDRTVKCWGLNGVGQLGLGDTGSRGDQANEMGDNLPALDFWRVGCGDGIVQSYEQCDDDNSVNGDGCDNNCKTTACGNGIVTAGEQCDDGNGSNTDACLNSCNSATCGDGYTRAGVEQCDDANGSNTDACTNACNSAVCGDGYIRSGVEVCDDHNTTSGDGCDSNCTVTACGNGIATGSEECDDGNAVNTDACLNACLNADCGDGVVWSGFEECDDDNSSNEDSCLNSCEIATCGDGYTEEFAEECDDGNSSNTDACVNTCMLAVCGDQFVWAGTEGCDDGNSSNTDACLNSCNNASCGDGYTRAGVEQCDDANASNTDACLNSCNNATCGDGYVRSGSEVCDDSNASGGDGCSSSCLWEALQVVGGQDHSCARFSNGAVKCWGNNSNGQLGLGDTVVRGDGANEMGSNLSTVALGTGRTATSIGAGSLHSCALLDNGTVKCWGWNSSGQLGLGNTSDRGDGANEMGDNLPAISLGTGRTALAISVGETHTCARLDNNTLKCWGSGSSGRLGQGNTTWKGDGANEMGDNLAVISLGTGRTALSVSAGNQHTCAVLDNNTIKCWGYNLYGQLGLGDTSDRGDGASEMGDFLSPVSLGTGRTAQSVSAIGNYTCARLDNNSVKCWGNNNLGALGLGDTSHRGDAVNEMGDNLPTVSLGTGRTASSLQVGRFYSAGAVLDNNTVKCWGDGNYGQLGQGNTNARGDGANEMGDNLTAISLGSGRTAIGLTGGTYHKCAVLDNRTIKCWGRSNMGQLGLGDTSSRGDGANEMGDNLPAVNFWQ